MSQKKKIGSPAMHIHNQPTAEDTWQSPLAARSTVLNATMHTIILTVVNTALLGQKKCSICQIKDVRDNLVYQRDLRQCGL